MKNPRGESYKYWLYEYEHPSIDSILFHLDSLLRKFKRLKLNIMVIYAARPLGGLVQEWSPEGFESRITGGHRQDIFTLTVNRDTLEGRIEEKALVLRFGQSQIYLLINDYVTGRTNEVLLPFLNAFYPDIARIYYSSFELYHILRRLQDKMEGTSIVLHRSTEVEGVGKGRRTTSVSYMSKPFEAIFKSVFDRKVWINNVLFSVQDWNKSLVFKGYLSKNGRFRCSRSFRTFYEDVIMLAANMAEEKRNAFTGRNRTKDHLTPQILQVSYDEEIFDRELTSRFSEILTLLPSSAYSILHKNPYFHAALLDRLDGSSYDLWIVTPNAIHIVPQLRASVASLSRLVHYIFENFREGDIEGYVRSSA